MHLQFIGPTAPVMAALGDKVSANILAQTAEVPSIPWSGGGIKAELNDEGVIPKEIFDSACVFDVEGAVATAEKIGYPVMIKASEGGGGKGIRMANNLEELRSGFVQVRRNLGKLNTHNFPSDYFVYYLVIVESSSDIYKLLEITSPY